jgi:hypothetical protein
MLLGRLQEPSGRRAELRRLRRLLPSQLDLYRWGVLPEYEGLRQHLPGHGL